MMFSLVFVSTLVHVAVALTDMKSRINPVLQDRAHAGHTFMDFSSVKPGQDVAAFLSAHGFYISNYPTSSTPVAHDFTPNNVAFGTGTLNMKVSAHTSGSVHSAEIVSTNAAKYGSVRVVYKSSSTKGVCEGNFFYLNDTQEIDFEMLTTTTQTASSSVRAGIWATNQALVPDTAATDKTIPLSFNPASAFHEYRVDWTAQGSTFYIDGVKKATLTKNIPTAPLYYIFNVWSSGDKYWSAGPPTKDSITYIKSIDLYQGYLP